MSLDLHFHGALVSATDNTVSINRDLTGAGTPQAIDITFEDPFGSVTALYDVRSQISQLSQDGSPLGTLADFSVGESGVITGIFTNGLLRNLGQVVLAKFADDHGLLEIGNNLYQASVNSGDALALTPGTGGAGTVLGRSLELSNVDLAAEFVTLINASTGFSANSRVLTTSERLIQELLASTR